MTPRATIIFFSHLAGLCMLISSPALSVCTQATHQALQPNPLFSLTTFTSAPISWNQTPSLSNIDQTQCILTLPSMTDYGLSCQTPALPGGLSLSRGLARNRDGHNCGSRWIWLRRRRAYIMCFSEVDQHVISVCHVWFGWGLAARMSSARRICTAPARCTSPMDSLN